MDEEKLQGIIEKLIESFSEEQKAKAAECETLDDLIKFAGDEGVELPEELLDEVGGGRLTFTAIRNGIFGGIGGGIGIKPLFSKAPKYTGANALFNTSDDSSAVHTIFDTGNKVTATDAVQRKIKTPSGIVPTGIIVSDNMKNA